MTERKIKTYHQFPPIPIRTLDWIAYREGDEEGGYGDDGLSPAPGSLFGYGPTEEAAIKNLIEEEGYNDMEVSPPVLGSGPEEEPASIDEATVEGSLEYFNRYMAGDR